MKTTLKLAVALLAGFTAQAAITIPGITGTPAEGSDGVLNVSSSTIDLSLATDAAWDAVSPDPGKGVYDSNKWAVVFKYSSVNITGEVNFKNHPSRAPVVWLVSGDVNVSGVLYLHSVNVNPIFSEPGPGGFRGANGTYAGTSGFGPGGAKPGSPGAGLGASHRNQPGSRSGPAYGQAELPLLIGGSGGGGRTDGGYHGGAGAGAILIFASGTITVNGTITARGIGNVHAGGGSGGVIRLVADTIAGTGVLNVEGGDSRSGQPQDYGGAGFIRTEALRFGGALNALPEASTAVLVEPAVLWPPENAPRTRIVSVGGASVSRDPRAQLGAAPADVEISPASSRKIVVETQNVPATAVVTVFVIPVTGSRTELTAINPIPAAGTTLLWEATLPAELIGRAALQARAIAP